MTHQSEALVASAMLRHARRALLVFGGAVVWWLVFLSGGSAHADGQATHPGDGAVSTVQHVKAQVEVRADRATSTATETIRSTPHRVTGAVKPTAAHAPEPVRTAIVRLTDALEPSLSAPATTLADTVDRTVDSVQAIVDPVLQATEADPATTSAPVAGTAPRHHASASQPRVHAVSTSTPASSTDQVATTRAQPAGQAPDREPGLPSPTSPALPTPSANGGSTNGSALLAVAALIPPATRRLRRGRRDDTVPSGPAYQPDSSPD